MGVRGASPRCGLARRLPVLAVLLQAVVWGCVSLLSHRRTTDSQRPPLWLCRRFSCNVLSQPKLLLTPSLKQCYSPVAEAGDGVFLCQIHQVDGGDGDDAGQTERRRLQHTVAPPVAATGSERVAYQKAMAASSAKMLAWKILCLKQEVNLRQDVSFWTFSVVQVSGRGVGPPPLCCMVLLLDGAEHLDQKDPTCG